MAMVTHDYPTSNALLVVDPDGNPIGGATVKIFNLIDFEANSVDTWIGQTETDAEGKWINPIEVLDGMTYVVLFQKYSEYGPTHLEITT
jgi:hypothetical protein